MAEQQLKAKITADAQGLKQAVAEGEQKLKDLKQTGEDAARSVGEAMTSTAGSAGQLGGAIGKVGSEFGKMGGTAGQAAQAVGQVGSAMAQAATGPIGMVTAAVSLLSLGISKLSKMLETNQAEFEAWKNTILQSTKEAAQAGIADAGKNQSTIDTLQSLEGIALAQEKGTITPEQQLQRAQIFQKLRKQDAVLARELERAFEGRQSSDALKYAMQQARDKQIHNLEYAIRQTEAEAESYDYDYEAAKKKKDWGKASVASKAASDARDKIEDLKAQIEMLKANAVGAEMDERQLYRQRAYYAAAAKESKAWGAEVKRNTAITPEQQRDLARQEVEKKFRELLKKNGIAECNAFGQENIGDAEYDALNKVRQAALADIERKYQDAKKEQWDKILAAEEAIRNAKEAQLSLEDQELSLQKSVIQQRQALHQQQYNAIKTANEKEKAARKAYAEAEHRLTKLKQDQLAKEQYEKTKKALEKKISNYGFTVPAKGYDRKHAALDARIADKLAREANGERVHWTRKERGRLNAAKNDAKALKKLEKKEQKRQRNAQEQEAERTLEIQKKTWQAAKDAADEVQKKFANIGESLDAAAKRLKGLIEGDQGEARKLTAEQNKRTKARGERQKQAQQRQAEAAQRGKEKAWKGYQGGDPYAKPPKRESLRTRRAREAREAKQAPPRTAPGVPAVAQTQLNNGREEQLLGEINDKLGKKVYVVR